MSLEVIHTHRTIERAIVNRVHMFRTVAILFAGLASLCVITPARAEQTLSPGSLTEEYVEEPMPPGFRVEMSELEGPVFANADGYTLYQWPSHRLRNGYSGETPGNPACFDEVSTTTAGLMSPYPPGIRLPDLDTRPSCTDLWPPVVANDDAKPVGRWTVVLRKDGIRQWMYDEQPLYTSVRDRQPGDALGGTTRRYGGDSPAYRVPVGPPPKIPPGFAIKTTSLGRLLTTDKNYSVYTYAGDTATRSNCLQDCARTWIPVAAPSLARAGGQWSIIERSPGVRQWVYRGKPLYTHSLDPNSWSLEGSDVDGWSNVYTQLAPSPPDSFTVRDSIAGQVLADQRGMTIYVYVCGDDSIDQLNCDHPNDTQVYRLAMCGGGDADRCQAYWKYVEAEPGSSTASTTWRVVSIDPATGRFAADEQANALSVWAYRDRPVYTFAGDLEPGDVNGSGTGEWRAQRNGLKAFWLRDDFMRGTL